MEITKEWIAQQRAVCEAATPGKWTTAVIIGEQYKCAVAGETGLIAMDVRNSSDSAFIATARTALPAALDALEASMQREAEKDAEVERLKGELAAENAPEGTPDE